jgi:hypothetical protein
MELKSCPKTKGDCAYQVRRSTRCSLSSNPAAHRHGVLGLCNNREQ